MVDKMKLCWEERVENILSEAITQDLKHFIHFFVNE